MHDRRPDTWEFNSRRQRHPPALDDEELFIIEGSPTATVAQLWDNRRSAKNGAKCAENPFTAAITSTAQSQNPHRCMITGTTITAGTAPAAPPNHHDFFHDLWHETPRSAQQLNHFRDFLHDLWHETPQTTTWTTRTSTTCRETWKLVSA